MLDAVEELFEGGEELFGGLSVYDSWDWVVRHPVLRLSFGRGDYKDPVYLDQSVYAQLDAV